MSPREIRLRETAEAIGGPLARLGASLRDDGDAVATLENRKSSHELLATDAFLQRFQQVTDLVLRKLFPPLLAVLENSDTRHPFEAVLDRLDGYAVVSDVSWWIELNELRNRLIREYAMTAEQRATEIARAWTAAVVLHAEATRIAQDHALVARPPR